MKHQRMKNDKIRNKRTKSKHETNMILWKRFFDLFLTYEKKKNRGVGEGKGETLVICLFSKQFKDPNTI